MLLIFILRINCIVVFLLSLYMFRWELFFNKVRIIFDRYGRLVVVMCSGEFLLTLIVFILALILIRS